LADIVAHRTDEHVGEAIAVDIPGRRAPTMTSSKPSVDMRGPINFNLHGYRSCLLANVKGRWSAWQEGDVPPKEKEWLECPKHVTVISNELNKLSASHRRSFTDAARGNIIDGVPTRATE
jgi:hypothetical protein